MPHITSYVDHANPNRAAAGTLHMAGLEGLGPARGGTWDLDRDRFSECGGQSWYGESAAQSRGR